MSYCRWSSDNWKSDLYVYQHVGDFYSINVASNRTVGNAPEVPPLTDENVKDGSWQEAHDAQMKWLENAERVKIDLPYAGESFAIDTAAEAVIKLKELRELGYYVPQYAIDYLEDEAAPPTSGVWIPYCRWPS